MDQNGKSLGKIPHLPKPTTTGRPHLNSSRTSSVVAPGRLNAASWRLGSKVFPRALVKRSGHMPHDWTNGKILRSASCKVFGSITLGIFGGSTICGSTNLSTIYCLWPNSILGCRTQGIQASILWKPNDSSLPKPGAEDHMCFKWGWSHESWTSAFGSVESRNKYIATC